MRRTYVRAEYRLRRAHQRVQARLPDKNAHQLLHQLVRLRGTLRALQRLLQRKTLLGRYLQTQPRRLAALQRLTGTIALTLQRVRAQWSSTPPDPTDSV